MKKAKEMILADALDVAIKSSKKVIQLKRIIVIESILLLLLIIYIFLGG